MDSTQEHADASRNGAVKYISPGQIMERSELL